MNRKRRKLIAMWKKHRRGPYAPATFPHWQRQRAVPDFTSFAASMRDIYNRCSSGVGGPDVAIAGGELVNHALGTDQYDPQATYIVTEHGIEPME